MLAIGNQNLCPPANDGRLGGGASEKKLASMPVFHRTNRITCVLVSSLSVVADAVFSGIIGFVFGIIFNYAILKRGRSHARPCLASNNVKKMMLPNL
jgi:hypothetical protein